MSRWMLRKSVATGAGEERVERTAVCASPAEALGLLVGVPSDQVVTRQDGSWEWFDRHRQVHVQVVPDDAAGVVSPQDGSPPQG